MLPTHRLFTLYKARRPWPPDFSLLSKTDQFRLERRYRRRTKLKWARPRLQKSITIAQWGVGAACIIYSVFFMEMENENHMFKPIRNWVKEKKESFWSVPAAPQTTEVGGKK